MIRYFLLLPGYLMASAVLAQTVDHAYTDLDLEADCQWAEMGDEEAAMGGSAVCQGYGDYPVHVAEGDLRMFVAFGPTAEPFRFWQSFIKAPFPVSAGAETRDFSRGRKRPLCYSFTRPKAPTG